MILNVLINTVNPKNKMCHIYLSIHTSKFTTGNFVAIDNITVRASVLPFQKCVNSVSGFANSVFYRFRFAKFRFFTVSDNYNSVSFFSSRIFVVNNFCFQLSFSILIKKFYSVTVLR